MYDIYRQVNFTATTENGEMFTFGRKFVGIVAVIASFFMGTLTMVLREPNYLPTCKYYITSKYSYFALVKKEKENV